MAVVAELLDFGGVGGDEDVVELGAGFGGAIDPGEQGIAGEGAEEIQAAGRIVWWIQTRRSTRVMTSSVTSSGCTTETSPLCRARAWNTNAAA